MGLVMYFKSCIHGIVINLIRAIYNGYIKSISPPPKRILTMTGHTLSFGFQNRIPHLANLKSIQPHAL